MQAGTRRTLEFDRIIVAVGRLTQTGLGREAIAQVVPRPDPAAVGRRDARHATGARQWRSMKS